VETAQHVPTLGELGYIDPKQLAAMLEVEPTTVSNWRCKGFGPPPTKIHGNKIVYSLDGVKKWLADRAAAQAKAPTLVNGKGVAARPTRAKPKDQRRSARA
jgi:hypothetical protein